MLKEITRNDEKEKKAWASTRCACPSATGWCSGASGPRRAASARTPIKWI